MNKASFLQKSRMQALSILLLPHTIPDSGDFAPISVESNQGCAAKLETDHEEENFKDEQEFSFACANPQGSLISADEIFENGQIRPIIPVVNQSLLFVDAHNGVTSPLRPPLKKLFIEQHNYISYKLAGKPKGSYNEWSQEMTMFEVEEEASNESCKKSNSTGFSKLWRFQSNLRLRSNSNGTDTFVFLNPSVPTSLKPGRFDDVKAKNIILKKSNLGVRKMALSAHEKHYMMNRMRKESEKRRSFLPYKKQLVGFFANANRFSKNVHPF